MDLGCPGMLDDVSQTLLGNPVETEADIYWGMRWAIPRFKMHFDWFTASETITFGLDRVR
jgi:hypothetical protein